MDNSKKYTTIGFDYSGVIAGISGIQFSKRVCSILEISLSEYKDIYFGINYLLNIGDLSRNDFWKLFLEKIDKINKYKELINYIDNIRVHKINNDVLGLVKILKSKGYKLGIFSNYTSSEFDDVRKQLSRYFDVIVISSEIGCIKPSLEGYAAFFRQLRVNAEEVIFIDDSKQSLVTSEELGFEPILFENVEQLKENLVSLGIEL